MKSIYVAAALAAAGLVSSNADAAYLVQVLGLFGASTPATAESAPNAQFTLSFNLPDPFPFSVQQPGVDATTAFYNISYTLNGAPAGSGVQYGVFSNGTSGAAGIGFLFLDQSSLYLAGPSIETNGTLSSPSYNFYATFVAPSGQPYATSGSATVTVTNVADPAAVPEPASWALMIGGFGLVGGALRRARRSVVRFA